MLLSLLVPLQRLAFISTCKVRRVTSPFRGFGKVYPFGNLKLGAARFLDVGGHQGHN
jgi:hypothetical protein